MKVHDASICDEDGCALLSATGTRAFYLIRNPLDVAVAFANHYSREVAKIIDRMAEADFALAVGSRGLVDHLRQRLLSWSAHAGAGAALRGYETVLFGNFCSCSEIRQTA